MQAIHTILLIVYIIVCVALTIVVLMQEGKQAGLTGAISGAAETYWGKNKGRSMEGGMVLATKILATLFVVISLLLNLKIFA
ncbi:MAG TPA: preprotein translocase subunit SecG [Lachnospiraceae bacterium]|nr:preprotein translocase subunit SecG [Lachnospiraceae bacterium]